MEERPPEQHKRNGAGQQTRRRPRAVASHRAGRRPRHARPLAPMRGAPPAARRGSRSAAAASPSEQACCMIDSCGECIRAPHGSSMPRSKACRPTARRAGLAARRSMHPASSARQRAQGARLSQLAAEGFLAQILTHCRSHRGALRWAGSVWRSPRALHSRECTARSQARRRGVGDMGRASVAAGHARPRRRRHAFFAQARMSRQLAADRPRGTAGTASAGLSRSCSSKLLSEGCCSSEPSSEGSLSPLPRRALGRAQAPALSPIGAAAFGAVLLASRHGEGHFSLAQHQSVPHDATLACTEHRMPAHRQVSRTWRHCGDSKRGIHWMPVAVAGLHLTSSPSSLFCPSWPRPRPQCRRQPPRRP
jgi:hypothetical protein